MNRGAIQREWQRGVHALLLATALVVSACGGGGGTSTAGLAPSPPPGTLDKSFGVGGIATASVGGYAGINAIALQPDGRILVAGYASIGGGARQILLVRFTPNGDLDSSFGGRGKVLSSPYAGDTEAIGIALQPDGRVVVLGGGSTAALVRYTATGTLDSTFGNGGLVPVGAAVALATQSDGRIVVARPEAGNLNSSITVGIVRFTSDGAVDTSFGTGGETIEALPPPTTVAPSIAIQPDGKILFGWSAKNEGTFGGISYSVVARLGADGSLDRTFAGSSLDPGLAQIALQSDGSILARITGTSSFADSAVSRLLSNGVLDPAFGAGGTVDGISGILAVQPNEKIVAAESADVDTAQGQRTAFSLTRYGSDGAIDESFGSRGTVVTSVEANDGVGAVAIDGKGQIVVAGAATTDPEVGFPQSALVDVVVVRYQGDAMTVTSP